MAEIRTDGSTVSNITGSFKSSISGMNFKNKGKISYSETKALSDLKECLSSLDTAISDFKVQQQRMWKIFKKFIIILKKLITR